jgi:hypothetical protein
MMPCAASRELIGWVVVLAGTVRVVRQGFILEDVIGSHTCSLEASKRVTIAIHLGCSLLLLVDTANSVQTLKVRSNYRCVCGPTHRQHPVDRQ